MRLLLLLLVAIVPDTLAPPGSVCSTSVFSSLLRSGEIYLLGTARADTIQVPFADPPRYLGPVDASATEPPADFPLVGWIVQVEQLAGAAADAIPAGTSEVILVPWGYGADCRPQLWQADKPWLQPQQRGVFSAYVRPLSHWVQGRPVLDVFLAWHQPYPGGEFLVYEARRSRSPDPQWLTIAEYWSLIQALPSEEQARTAPEEAKASLRHWEQAHPIAARRFPASMILEWAPHEISSTRHQE